MTLHTVTGNLIPKPPFDFAKTLNFLGHFRPAMGEQAIGEGVLTKAIMCKGRVVVFRLASSGTVEAPELVYTLYTEDDLDEISQREALERIRFFLSLADDLQPFYAVGQDDPAFASVIDDLYGYHQVKFLTPFENACWAILSQRNSMSVSRGMKDRLTTHYGSGLKVDGIQYYGFPEPSQLAIADEAELNRVIGNRWKTAGILSVARAFDQVDEDWLYTAPYQSVETWLRSIKGIGAWSASFILLRGLGHMNQLPVAEKWLLEAARRTYGQPTLTMDDLARLAKPYGDYAGYWAHYLRAAI